MYRNYITNSDFVKNIVLDRVKRHLRTQNYQLFKFKSPLRGVFGVWHLFRMHNMVARVGLARLKPARARLTKNLPQATFSSLWESLAFKSRAKK